MIEDHRHIEIEKFTLPGESPGQRVLQAFTEYESENPQFGLDWLVNLASNALAGHERAVVFVASLTPDDFLALPLKLDTLNGHAEALSTFYTSAYSPILQGGSGEALLTALFQHLLQEQEVKVLLLSPMLVEAPVFSRIETALANSGWKGCHRFFCFGNWVLNTQRGNYRYYLENRPSQLRNTITRKTRQFLKDNAGSLELINGEELQENALEKFSQVYNKSWKVEEPFPAFMPGLLRLAARRGWLRLGFAYYNKQAIAGQIWLVCAGKAYIYKLAYDEKFKQLSPGTVLTAYMMQHVIEGDLVSHVNFLSGDDSFKKDWMNERREFFGIAAYNSRTLRGALRLTGYLVKTRLKKVFNR